MPDREPRRSSSAFQVDAQHARLARRPRLRLRRTLHAGQALRVDDDRALGGSHRAAHATTGAVRHQAHAIATRQRDQRLDLLGPLRPGHERWLRPPLGGERLGDQVTGPGVARSSGAIDALRAGREARAAASRTASARSTRHLYPPGDGTYTKRYYARVPLLLGPGSAAAPSCGGGATAGAEPKSAATTRTNASDSSDASSELEPRRRGRRRVSKRRACDDENSRAPAATTAPAAVWQRHLPCRLVLRRERQRWRRLQLAHRMRRQADLRLRHAGAGCDLQMPRRSGALKVSCN